MVIIKYYEWLLIQELMQPKTGIKPDLYAIYELCDDDLKKIRKISKKEAIDLINENNLVRVHKDQQGVIWR